MREKHTLGRVQQRRSRAEVEQLVDAFEASGLRRREFCQKHAVVVGTLDFWRKRRRQKRGVVASHQLEAHKVHAGAEVASSGRLVAVELAGTASSGRLAVVLARGRRVEVSEGFDAATLERLLAVLEQA
jgi:hypothetical protein